MKRHATRCFEYVIPSLNDADLEKIDDKGLTILHNIVKAQCLPMLKCYLNSGRDEELAIDAILDFNNCTITPFGCIRPLVQATICGWSEGVVALMHAEFQAEGSVQAKSSQVCVALNTPTVCVCDTCGREKEGHC